MSNNFCLVPESELLKLEETRKRLIEHLAPEGCDIYKTMQAISLTDGLWKLANRKWKKVSFENKEIFVNRLGTPLSLAEIKRDIEATKLKTDSVDALMFTTATVKALVEKIEELQSLIITKGE
jgi:hypothetical protein